MLALSLLLVLRNKENWCHFQAYHFLTQPNGAHQLLIHVSTVFAGPYQDFVDDSLGLDCENKTHAGLWQTNFEGMAMVELDAMQRANSTLEDFVSTCLSLCMGLR